MTTEAPAWNPDGDMAEILISQEQLQARIVELGEQILSLIHI